MVLGILDRVVRCGGCDKVGGDDLSTLVDELVEGMLAIRARSAPDDGLWKKTFSTKHLTL